MNDNPDYKCLGCEFGCIAKAVNSTMIIPFHTCEQIYREFLHIDKGSFCTGQFHSDNYPEGSLAAACACDRYLQNTGDPDGYYLYGSPRSATHESAFEEQVTGLKAFCDQPPVTYDPNKKLIVVFNGPPGSGKDTIVDHLMAKTFKKRSVGRTTFKKALVKQVQNLFTISDTNWWTRYDASSSTGDRMKDLPWDRLDGLSQRGALIAMSEAFTKPTFGNDYYGKALLKEIRSKSANVILIPDGGFKEELAVLENAEDLTVMVIQLERHGCSFKGDSRRYIRTADSRKTTRLKVADGKPYEDAEKCAKKVQFMAKSVENLQF